MPPSSYFKNDKDAFKILLKSHYPDLNHCEAGSRLRWGLLSGRLDTQLQHGPRELLGKQGFFTPLWLSHMPRGLRFLFPLFTTPREEPGAFFGAQCVSVERMNE